MRGRRGEGLQWVALLLGALTEHVQTRVARWRRRLHRGRTPLRAASEGVELARTLCVRSAIEIGLCMFLASSHTRDPDPNPAHGLSALATQARQHVFCPRAGFERSV